MVKIIDMKEIVKIPEGVQVTIQGKTVQVKGSKGTVSKELSHPRVTLTLKDSTIEILCAGTAKRKEKALLGTYKALLRNMMKGVTQGYECKMKTVFSHFPIKTTVEGNHVLISNFLGERYPRKAEILENVKVEVKAESITITGIDKENVGQTAANIERATKVKNRDIRVFQDGCYIVKRG